MSSNNIWKQNMGHDKKIENIINSYERKILRRILGPINDKGMWRIRYNKEIYNLYGDLELSTVIKLRLQWAGHVQRMESQSIPKMAMAGQMFGKCPVWEPRKRWPDAMKEDSYQMMKWRDWQVKAQDREEWWSRIKKAKAHFGLQRH
jgi:hypothetical protein